MAVTPTTWNPSDKDSTVTLSGGNLTADSSGGGVRSVYSATAGKFYWEVTYPVAVAGQMIGVATSSASVADWPGWDAFGWAFESNSGNIYTNGAIVATSGIVPVTTLSVLLDADAKELRFWADGVDCGVVISLTGTAFYAVVGYYGKTTAKFGATAFNHTPPAGYEAGFVEPDLNRTILPGGALAFASGTPAVVEGPNRVVNAPGTLAFAAGTPTAVLEQDVTVSPASALAFAAGTPTAIRGPNRVVQAEGALAFAAGTPTVPPPPAQFIEVPGTLAFAAGTPAVEVRFVLRPEGVCVVRSGTPMVLADQVTTRTTVAVPGALAFAAGTPTAKSAVTVSAGGSLAFAAGTPKAGAAVHPAGALAFAAGTPKANIVVHPSGTCAFAAGAPKAASVIHPLGTCVARSGTPRATAAGVIQAHGSLAFASGTPRISDVAVRARPSLAFAAGTPTIDRGATC